MAVSDSTTLQSGSPPGRPTLRERERELDIRSSLLDTDTDIGFKEAVRIVARASGYLRYFAGRFTIKVVMMWIASAVPLLILPWPVKMMIDHVVLGRPIEQAQDYPAFMWPIIEALYGSSALEILFWLALVGVSMMLLIGAYPGGRDQVVAALTEGKDVATSNEAAMHIGHSSLGALYGYVEFRLQTRLTQALNHTLRAELFSRIESLSMTQLEDQRIGDSIYRILYDTPQITEIFYEVIHTPLVSVTLYIAAAAVMLDAYPNSPEIIWMSLLFLPIWLSASSLFARTVRRRGQASRAAGSITTSTIEEGMDNVLAVQSLGGNQKEKQRFGDDSGESFRRFRAERLIWFIMFQCSELTRTIIEIGVFVYILTYVIEGQFSAGDYGALYAFWRGLRGPTSDVAWLWIRLQNNVAGVRRVFALMDLPPEADTGTTHLPPIHDGISIQDAGFVYPDGRRALADVTLEAKVGEIVAFVGPTGSGKTTLAYLIPRFHQVTEGEVRIDGYDVNDLTIDSMRDQITYVFQETQLLSDSIADNIRYGNPDAVMAEVERVAKTAGVHDFISSLPEGYETILGTSNSKLSVGQKQRISIARGLLRNSKVLILDEPTSSLDPETEEYLVQSLHEAAKDRVVIIIAHRLSTIAQAHKIIFLEEGKVKEQGSHDELLAREDGRYREFVELQTQAV
jgi:ABC-type multidrug transport system fused ATPase/permease subunit